jgi:hypothetical protein
MSSGKNKIIGCGHHTGSIGFNGNSSLNQSNFLSESISSSGIASRRGTEIEARLAAPSKPTLQSSYLANSGTSTVSLCVH